MNLVHMVCTVEINQLSLSHKLDKSLMITGRVIKLLGSIIIVFLHVLTFGVRCNRESFLHAVKPFTIGVGRVSFSTWCSVLSVISSVNSSSLLSPVIRAPTLEVESECVRGGMSTCSDISQNSILDGRVIPFLIGSRHASSDIFHSITNSSCCSRV